MKNAYAICGWSDGYNAFTLNALISPSVNVNIYSRTLVRTGFKQNIIFNCKNNGNVDAIGTMLFIYLPYGSEFTISDSIIISGDSLINLDSIPDYFVDAPFAFTQDSFFVVPLMIPLIEVNSFKAIRITLKNPISNSYIAAAVGKPLYSQTSFNSNSSAHSLSQTCDNIDALECTLDIITLLHGFLPEPAGCIIGTLNTIIKAVLDANCKPIDNDFYYGLGKSLCSGFLSCYGLGKLEALKDATKVMQRIAEISAGIISGRRAGHLSDFADLESCIRVLEDPNPPVTPLIPISSFDPNVKIGPQLYESIQDFNYSIYFENKPSATAAAQQVTIIDTLDLNSFDLKTFNFVGFGFGPQNEIVQSGNRFNFSHFENLNTNSSVSILGNLDTITGIVTWEFKTIDRLTGLLTDDPLEGFLPPNDSSGIGEGFIAYSIKPKPNLSNRDSISNRATIVFDFNEPITTNTSKNILDLDKPFSNVISADSITSDTAFVLNWTGNDSTSSIKSYNIFVSDSMNQYFELLTNFTDTNIIFHGVAGHYYRFYSVATDSAGNIEDVPNSEDYHVFIDGFRVNATIRLFIEGFYLSDSTLISSIDPVLYPNICDTLVIELHSAISPYSVKYSYKGILDIHGFIQCQFENVFRGLYYVVIKHRNAIETWSSNPLAINSSYFEYDFTTVINKAYGNNMLNVGNGRFAIFSGDISDGIFGVGYQDGVIESQDYSDMENAVSEILVGYVVQDITGDGVVESSDYSLMENNVSSIIFSIRP